MKVGPYRLDLQNETIRAILDLYAECLKDGKEKSLRLCSSNGMVSPSRPCTGTLCRAAWPEVCAPHSHYEGLVHTHPGGADSGQSAGDMLSQLHECLYEGTQGLGCRTGFGGWTGTPYRTPVNVLQCEIPQPCIPEWQYLELHSRYLKDVMPIYDEWERTGTNPAQSKWAIERQMEAELRPLFQKTVIPLDSLRPTEETMVIDMRNLSESDYAEFKRQKLREMRGRRT